MLLMKCTILLKVLSVLLLQLNWFIIASVLLLQLNWFIIANQYYLPLVDVHVP